MIVANFDYSSLERARRSMLTIAIFTLLFGAINLQSNVLEIFGLKISVDHAAFVEILRFALCWITLLFFMRSLQAFPRQWHKAMFLRDRKWEKIERKALREFEQKTFDPEYDPLPHDVDYDTAFYEERWERRQRREKLLEISNTLISSVGLSLDYFFPLLISLGVLMDPYALSSILG